MKLGQLFNGPGSFLGILVHRRGRVAHMSQIVLRMRRMILPRVQDCQELRNISKARELTGSIYIESLRSS